MMERPPAYNDEMNRSENPRFSCKITTIIMITTNILIVILLIIIISLVSSLQPQPTLQPAIPTPQPTVPTLQPAIPTLQPLKVYRGFTLQQIKDDCVEIFDYMTTLHVPVYETSSTANLDKCVFVNTRILGGNINYLGRSIVLSYISYKYGCEMYENSIREKASVFEYRCLLNKQDYWNIYTTASSILYNLENPSGHHWNITRVEY